MVIKAHIGKSLCNFCEGPIVLLLSMSAFSDVRKMLIARQAQYKNVSEMKIVKLEYY